MKIHSHSDRAFSVKDFLSRSECSELVALAEANSFVPAAVRTDHGERFMQSVRNNDKTLVEHPQWVGRLWRSLDALPLPDIGGERAVGLPRALRFYRYSPGQRFKMHKDGPWREDGLVSKLTLLVYLNDDFAGGATDFRDFVVSPEAGMALLFVHDTWHEGRAVIEGHKYVLRSDVLYAGADLSPSPFRPMNASSEGQP